MNEPLRQRIHTHAQRVNGHTAERLKRLEEEVAQLLAERAAQQPIEAPTEPQAP